MEIIIIINILQYSFGMNNYFSCMCAGWGEPFLDTSTGGCWLNGKKKCWTE